MIKEVKPLEAKSDDEILDIIYDALKVAREDKVLSITLTMSTKKYSYTTFSISSKGTYSETLGNIEKLKDKILMRWREK